MEQHRLNTITQRALAFTEAPTQLCIVNCNVQSLRAHSSDVGTDHVLRRGEYLALTETWLRDDEPAIPIDGYECVNRSNNRHPNKNAAGGVAIYKSVDSLTTCKPITLTVDRRFQATADCIGDMALANVTFDSKLSFILASVYIHPGAAL